jgi:ubiquinone/menaquinone biosynthesis C-methylase UbiE
MVMNRAEKYYDKFSSVYDLLSPDWYYRNPRKFAIRSLALEEGSSVLNLPCGTGQNFSYLQHYLNGIGKVVGVDLSSGMLQKAQRKINANGWDNISLFKEDATAIDKSWVKTHLGQEVKFDAILCDLGLSGFPEWRNVIDNLLSLLRPGGRFVIMDWYIEKPGLRAEFVKWIGGGEVDRPLYQYLAERVDGFRLEDSFKGGDVFVAWGKFSLNHSSCSNR